MRRSARPLGGAVFAMGLLAVSQPPWGLWWIAPVALAPWLVGLWRMPAWAGVLSGFAVGTGSGAITVHWIAEGLAALGATPFHAGLGVAVVAGIGAGVPWALVGGVAAVLRSLSPGARVAAFALSLFAVDAARSHLPGGLPWALLGHSQGSAPGVAQLAVLGGVPLVSALVAALNAALAVALSPGKAASGRAALRWVGAGAAAYAALALLGLPAAEWSRRGAPPGPAEPLEILVVQPDLPLGERWSAPVQRTNLAITARQTARALAETPDLPDLVVWPETALTNPLDTDSELRRDLLRHVDALGVPLVLGAVRSGPSGNARHYRNSALWVAPERGIVDAFDKTLAIPVVESAAAFPGRGLFESLLGIEAQRRYVEEAAENRPLRGSRAFAVALCFEALFPGLVEARRTPDTAAILHLANDRWFASQAPSLQQLAFVSFRAIEQRLPVVRAAYGGGSAVIDAYGRVARRLPFGERGSLRTAVLPQPPPSAAERATLSLLVVFAGTLGYAAGVPFTRRILPWLEAGPLASPPSPR